MFKGLPIPSGNIFLRMTVAGKVHAKCKISGHQQTPCAERMTSHHSLCAKLHNQATNSDTVRETNIQHYFIFMFVIYKYTNFDIMIIHN